MNQEKFNAGAVSKIPHRERILRRTFKLAIQHGKYKQNEFHSFCVWAKGKGETELIRLLST